MITEVAKVTEVTEVTEVTKEVEQHRDVERHWQELCFSMTTYTAGGVATKLDLKLADIIDAIVKG
ncbi:4a-hydroxytetrahydrobiopterin dehydratase [Embleya sp. AB8]|uniref:4a-hydroxytetrahydrobiopterin dehydratase n=1 Tax=Embleya sp. AB8 TaxID=3156304 RepID=UPI003C715001